MNNVNMDEEVNGVPEIGDVIRTKKMQMQGKVERLGTNRAGYSEVFFRVGDGRLMVTPLSNVTVIEKLADEDLVMEVNEDRIDEISNEVLAKYKKHASADASKADKQGDYAKGNKRFSGIVKATKKQFDNDSKKKTSEGSMGGLNRSAPAVDVSYEKVLDEVFARWEKEKKLSEADFGKIVRDQDQAPKPGQTTDKDYNGWIIRHQLSPKAPGQPIQWMAWHSKKDPSTAKRGTSTDPDRAFQDATAFINSGGDGERKEASKNVTIDFNTEFAKEFAPGGETFYATIDDGGGFPMLILSTEPQKGLKTSHLRSQEHKMTATSTKLPTISLSPAESNAAGLQPHGRYIVGDKDPVDDNTAMFPLIFQSTAQSKEDRMRMGAPGLTVAHSRTVDEEYQGPWAGDPVKSAKAPKSTMQGSTAVPFSRLVQDTIKQHGLKWAFEYYVKKNGLPPRQFRIFAGI